MSRLLRMPGMCSHLSLLIPAYGVNPTYYQHVQGHSYTFITLVFVVYYNNPFYWKGTYSTTFTYKCIYTERITRLLRYTAVLLV